MKAIRSVKNQYLGINAHLHSYWQSDSTWSGLHTTHIGDLLKLLKAQLIPMGYTADVEQSLQIRLEDQTVSRPRADAMIYDFDPIRSSTPPTPQNSQSQVLTLPIPVALQEYDLSGKPYRAVVIYERSQGRGEPVAWLELLSPSNKGESDDAQTYREKRRRLLHSGIVFIELDYLHETIPTINGVPAYYARKGSTTTFEGRPYRIVVTDPRPEFEQGKVYIHQFDVDQAIPVVPVPLNGNDVLDFDFGVPYRKTFEEGLYGYDLDYAQLPLNFDRYSPSDQTRIVRRMVAVLEAAKNGADLETAAPLEVEPLTLEEGLARLDVVKSEFVQ